MASEEPTVTVVCRSCLASRRHGAAGLPRESVCVCGRGTPLSAEGRKTEAGEIRMCFACGCGYLWVEKDFSIRAGCLILFAAVAVSVGLLAAGLGEAALLFLLGVAAADAAVYLLVGKRTVCYRCDAEYRGFPLNPRHGPYELGLGAKFSDAAEPPGDEPRDPA